MLDHVVCADASNGEHALPALRYLSALEVQVGWIAHVRPLVAALSVMNFDSG